MKIMPGKKIMLVWDFNRGLCDTGAVLKPKRSMIIQVREVLTVVVDD